MVMIFFWSKKLLSLCLRGGLKQCDLLIKIRSVDFSSFSVAVVMAADIAFDCSISSAGLSVVEKVTKSFLNLKLLFLGIFFFVFFLPRPCLLEIWT
jgi:hypothetical protein